MKPEHEIAENLAAAIDAADHMVLRDVGPTQDDEFVDSYVSGDSHNLVIKALRFYADSKRNNG